MTDSVPRFPDGARKYPSHFELEEKGWIRGDPAEKLCTICGVACEWWGRPGRVGWKLFNRHTTQEHSVTCAPKR